MTLLTSNIFDAILETVQSQGTQKKNTNSQNRNNLKFVFLKILTTSLRAVETFKTTRSIGSQHRNASHSINGCRPFATQS